MGHGACACGGVFMTGWYARGAPKHFCNTTYHGRCELAFPEVATSKTDFCKTYRLIQTLAPMTLPRYIALLYCETRLGFQQLRWTDKLPLSFRKLTKRAASVVARV